MSPSRRRRRASPEWEGRDTIEVAALPGRGVYARHLGHPEGVDGVHRPTVPPPGTNRPSPQFEAGWLTAHVDDVDVVHVQGLPLRASREAAQRAIAVIRKSQKPLVFTAYHLSDPSGTEEGGAMAAQQAQDYTEAMTAVIEASATVVTLTASAAGEIRDRWGVEAHVVPHPHVVDFVRMRRERVVGRRGALLVGADLGSLRMPGDPEAFVAALAESVQAVAGSKLVVHLHENLLDPESSRYRPDTIKKIQQLVEEVGGSTRVHRPMTDSQLWDHLFSLDVSVVPPIHGSHSIWPEACFDLGTRCVLPAGSHAADQKPSLTYRVDTSGRPDTADLTAALKTFSEQQGSEISWRADAGERWRERVEIAESLRMLYENELS